jgi:hypothetical protein
MTVLRIKRKEKNFLILDKTCLNESKISWGAKGLHSYLMGLPSDWRVRVLDLQNRATNGRDSVRALLNELEKAGYILKEWVRNTETGKFNCLEYVVYEVSQKQPEKDNTIYPCPENPSPENPATENPSPENPATENPSPEDPPLININSSKYTNNKEITAAVSAHAKPDHVEQEAAAVISNKNNLIKKPNPPCHPKSPVISYLAPEDAVIRGALTENQIRRIEALIEKLNLSNVTEMIKEVSYCLLHKKHFTDCGQDFSRKLNAIRVVIKRGEWQTPAGMVMLEEKPQKPDELIFHQSLLSQAYAEVNHFERLHAMAKEDAKPSLTVIIEKTKLNIGRLEKQLLEMKLEEE